MKRLSILTPQRVEALFHNSLCREDEIENGKATVPIVIAEGITVKVGFNKDRLYSHREEIRLMLGELPPEFKSVQSGGRGGQSFSKIGLTKEGIQWTGFEKIMEQFCLMAIGLGLAKFPFPRKAWAILPNSVPDFCIN